LGTPVFKRWFKAKYSLEVVMKVLTCVLSLYLVLFMCGCSDDDNDAPAGSGSLGNLAGKVIITDSSNHYTTTFDGVNVHLEGTGYNTLTDSSGQWSFNNIPSGAYTANVAKSGFGLMRLFGISVDGNGTNYAPTAYLYKVPTDSVVVDHIDTGGVSNQGAFTIFIRSTGATFGYFIDRTSDVNPEDRHALTSFFNRINVADLHRIGLHAGNICYVSACAVGHSAAAYNDPVTGGFNFTACGPKSNVIVLAVP
jgi:hypothetical protein